MGDEEFKVVISVQSLIVRTAFKILEVSLDLLVKLCIGQSMLKKEGKEGVERGRVVHIYNCFQRLPYCKFSVISAKA